MNTNSNTRRENKDLFSALVALISSVDQWSRAPMSASLNISPGLRAWQCTFVTSR